MEAVIERTGRRVDWKSLLARRSKKVTGLVVSIGVIGQAEGGIPDRVVRFVRSLGGTGDFVYRAGDHEFALIWRGEQGPAAQRRLARISRELWDFQLGSLGDFAILFTWGGVEVEDESIEEAIALATMRMEETRRGRKALVTGKIRAASAYPAAHPS